LATLRCHPPPPAFGALAMSSDVATDYLDALKAKYTTAEDALKEKVKKNEEKIGWTNPDGEVYDKFNPSKLGDCQDLCKVKDIQHSVKKMIPHGKKSSDGQAPNKIMALAWSKSANDPRMAIIDQMGACFVWDTEKTLRCGGFIYPFAQCLALAPKSCATPMVLVGGMRNASELYIQEPGVAKMKAKKTWIAHDGYISSIHFMAEGAKYISSSGDGDIRLFDIEKSGKSDSLVTLCGHSKDAQSIKFPRDDKSENVFITCSSDKTVKMWDLRSAECTHTFKTFSELNACSMFPNGQMIACGGEKDKTFVFDVRANRIVNLYRRNNQKTASCEFSKSGRELYVGHDDGSIIVWDIFASGKNKEYAHKIEAHTTFKDEKKTKPDETASRVQVLDVGPDGFLASGGFDGKVKIWGAPDDAGAPP